MEKILLKPARSEVLYQGRFEQLSFGPLVNPAPLYQNLLKYLGKFGATLPNLTYVAPPVADANISCFLTQLAITSQFRLDRLEINFLRFHEVGADIAKQILLDSWAALHEVDASILIIEHTVGLTVYTEIQGASYDQIVGRYVTIPPGLGDGPHAGIAFYLSGDPTRGERPSAIVLDRIAGPEQNILVRVTTTFDAKQVPLEDLTGAVEAYLNRYLDHLGLAIERGEAP